MGTLIRLLLTTVERQGVKAAMRLLPKGLATAERSAIRGALETGAGERTLRKVLSIPAVERHATRLATQEAVAIPRRPLGIPSASTQAEKELFDLVRGRRGAEAARSFREGVTARRAEKQALRADVDRVIAEEGKRAAGQQRVNEIAYRARLDARARRVAEKKAEETGRLLWWEQAVGKGPVPGGTSPADVASAAGAPARAAVMAAEAAKVEGIPVGKALVKYVAPKEIPVKKVSKWDRVNQAMTGLFAAQIGLEGIRAFSGGGNESGLRLGDEIGMAIDRSGAENTPEAANVITRMLFQNQRRQEAQDRALAIDQLIRGQADDLRDIQQVSRPSLTEVEAAVALAGMGVGVR